MSPGTSESIPAGWPAPSQFREQVFGKVGYRRVDGYEALMGAYSRTWPPTMCRSSTMGRPAISAGDSLTGATAAATVLAELLLGRGRAMPPGTLDALLTSWVGCQQHPIRCDRGKLRLLRPDEVNEP